MYSPRVLFVTADQSFSVGGRVYNNMIRTESYTYPGSSGGPLANISGEVIGINTAIYNPQGKFTGISFSMPINRALALLERSGIPAFCCHLLLPWRKSGCGSGVS